MGTLIFSVHCTCTVSYSKGNENHEVDLIRTAPPTPFLKVQAALTINLILLGECWLACIHMLCTIYSVLVLTDHNMLIAYKCTYNLIPYYDSIESN